MNTRRFYFYTTLIITGFLFFTGIIMLNFINASSDAYAFNDSGSLLDNILNDFKNTNEPINILVLGGDKVNQNSDTMILVNYDPSTAKISMLSIPRDTKVKIDGTNRKINYAFPHGGPALAAQTVSKLLDVKIKYYVYIDTKAFREIIDLLGGVDYYVPADMNYDDPIQNLHIHLTKGMQHMDGEMAEQFMRFRDPNKWTKELKKYYDGSDLKRIDAQQSFIKELIKQKMKLYNITKIKDIINTVFDNIETNIELDDAIKLSSGIAKINTDELNMMTLPGTTYDGSPWYFLCDNEAARELTKMYFKANDSFVYVPADTNNNTTDDSEQTKKPTNTKKSSTPKNPSNSNTSVKPSTQPMPK